MSLDYLDIALPKGRLGDKVYKLFASVGYDCKGLLEDSRKLIFQDDNTRVRYFLIKPSDVAVYVERGAADVGVVGKDILLETEPRVYELQDLKLGRCALCVAAQNGYEEEYGSMLRVATKYPNVAREYYRKQDRDIEIIKLNGSIELAPIIGLTDVIVDIVETGTTLKENGLSVYREIAPCSARLIANETSYKFKQARIEELIKKLSEVL
ncbi:ATP phosphoribosyltransferase [Eubacteriales bacterium OttesenSCG-928-K08]|nr:ATP phosphoribosyltransferase [Eubacteriales bacterium OttesenSCG-928-K08]